MYQDDFERNNALRSHEGAKSGGVYTVVPCLPVTMLSKTHNILTTTLYNLSNDKKVPLSKIFSKAVQECQFLKNEGFLIRKAVYVGFSKDIVLEYVLLKYCEEYDLCGLPGLIKE